MSFELDPREATETAQEWVPGFEVVRPLGRGPDGAVALCEQLDPPRRVVVRVGPRPLASDEEAAAFLSAAQEVAAVRHPHLVPLLDAGTTARSFPYVVTRYQAGGAVAQAPRAPREVAEVLRWGIHLGGALEAAHRAGLAHGSVGPARVLLDRYGRPALAGLGLCGSVPPGGSGPAGTVAGDIADLAALLHVLLEDAVGDVPSALLSVLHRAMDPAPTGPGSAMDLVLGLAYVERLLGLPPTDLGSSSPRDADRAAVREDVDDARRPRRRRGNRAGPSRRTRRVAAVAAGVCVAVGGVGAIALRPPPPPPAAATPPSPDVTVIGRRAAGESVEFAWAAPAARAGDRFAWRDAAGTGGVVTAPRLRLPAAAGRRICLQVAVLPAGRSVPAPWSNPACVTR